MKKQLLVFALISAVVPANVSAQEKERKKFKDKSDTIFDIYKKVESEIDPLLFNTAEDLFNIKRDMQDFEGKTIGSHERRLAYDTTRLMRSVDLNIEKLEEGIAVVKALGVMKDWQGLMYEDMLEQLKRLSLRDKAEDLRLENQKRDVQKLAEDFKKIQTIWCGRQDADKTSGSVKNDSTCRGGLFEKIKQEEKKWWWEKEKIRR